MSATANGFAHAFSTWIAGGNGLNSGKDGVMRYNAGPMKGMTRDAAQMKFQNQVWRNAPDAWKDEYAKRATTGMLSPSEQKAASGGLPTVRPPVRQATVAPMENGGNESGNLIEDQERDSKSAASKPMEILGTPTVSPPMMQSAPRSRGLATSQPAFGSRKGTGASETGRVAAVRC